MRSLFLLLACFVFLALAPPVESHPRRYYSRSSFRAFPSYQRPYSMVPGFNFGRYGGYSGYYPYPRPWIPSPYVVPPFPSGYFYVVPPAYGYANGSFPCWR